MVQHQATKEAYLRDEPLSMLWRDVLPKAPVRPAMLKLVWVPMGPRWAMLTWLPAPPVGAVGSSTISWYASASFSASNVSMMLSQMPVMSCDSR